MEDECGESPVESTQRDEAYYTALLNAFVGNRMERDKSLLALSSAGVGLTITLISTFGVNNRLEQWAYGAMLVGFVSVILLILTVYKINTVYVKGTIKEINDGVVDPRYLRVRNKAKTRLRELDKYVSFFFQVGIVASLILGLSLASTETIETHGQKTEQEDVQQEVDR